MFNIYQSHFFSFQVHFSLRSYAVSSKFISFNTFIIRIYTIFFLIFLLNITIDNHLRCARLFVCFFQLFCSPTYVKVIRSRSKIGGESCTLYSIFYFLFFSCSSRSLLFNFVCSRSFYFIGLQNKGRMLYLSITCAPSTIYFACVVV